MMNLRSDLLRLDGQVFIVLDEAYPLFDDLSGFIMLENTVQDYSKHALKKSVGNLEELETQLVQDRLKLWGTLK